MKKYKIVIFSNEYRWCKVFESTSRNAKKHLRDKSPSQDGAPQDGSVCEVCTMRGKAVSACAYSVERGYYYVTIAHAREVKDAF